MDERTDERGPAASGSAARTTRPVTVVTGGSEGIGLALAHRFAAGGHDLLLVARRAEPLIAAAAALRTAHGVRIEMLPLDLTEPDAMQALDARLAALGAHAGTIVNCAGIGLAGPFDAADPASLEALLALNVGVVTRTMRHFLPGMRARRRGGFLNVASMAGFAPGPWQATYYASKAYVLSLSEAVAQEVAADGVRVTVLAPGPVETAFHARMHAEPAFYRVLLPQASPARVAWWGYWGYRTGLRVVVPGVLNIVGAVCLRLLPHRLIIPILGWLLRRRQAGDR